MRIAVLTSGGDSPGMNAAIRAVVRCASAQGIEVVGIQHGYTGLINGDLRILGARDVGGIIDRAGTVLGTTRCESLRTPEGRARALQTLRDHAINGLVVIGGNGSQSGARELSESGARVIGIAATIDNDLVGSEISIGATTAIDVALEAIDRLRATAAAMRRAFLVEVMGRHCGYLALMAGMAGGAEAIVIPESETEPAQLADELLRAYDQGRSHAIVVVAEGAKYNARALMDYFREHENHLGFEVRATTLGHIQRGGAPGAFDRVLATRLGAFAVDTLLEGRWGVLVGLEGGRPSASALTQCIGQSRAANAQLLALARTLAR